MKTKEGTASPVKSPRFPLNDMIEVIKVKGNLTNRDIAKALGKFEDYLSKQLSVEKTGGKASTVLIDRVERKYEYILTGKRTFEIDQQELIDKMAEQITYIRAQLDVTLNELSVLLDPKNPSKKKRELTMSAKAAAEEMMRSM